MNTSPQIAELIESIVKSKKIIANKMLQECGLSKDTIVNMKRQQSLPSADKIAKLAEYLEVNTDYLLGKTNDPTPPSDLDEDVLKLLSIVKNLSVEDIQYLTKQADFLSSQQGE